MGLKKIFTSGVDTIFKVLKDAVKSANYIISNDDGWGEDSEESYPVRVILDQFTQEDVDTSQFSALIQPTDTKGMIPGKDLSVPMNTSNILDVEGRKFAIVAFETDPMQAMFTLLLRDTK